MQSEYDGYIPYSDKHHAIIFLSYIHVMANRALIDVTCLKLVQLLPF